jgi:CBS domain-containing protein
MAATFGAATRASFTAIVFAFELTRDYRAIVPLMMATVIADLVARALLSHDLMTEKLARRGLSVPRLYEPDYLRLTYVDSVMTRDVKVLDAKDSVDAALERFETVGHSALPVMADGRLVGIVTRTDMMSVPDGTHTVRDVASRDVVAIGVDETVLVALHTILDEGVDHLPVIGEEGRLVGIVTRTDIMRARAEASRADAPDGHRLRVGKRGPA